VVQLTVVGELFQPAALGAGCTDDVMTGGVVSDSTEPDVVTKPPSSSLIVTVTV
jgi:hypothetical protein